MPPENKQLWETVKTDLDEEFDKFQKKQNINTKKKESSIDIKIANMKRTLKKRTEGKIPLSNKNFSSSKQPEATEKTPATNNPQCQHNYTNYVALALDMKTSKSLPVLQRKSSRIINIPEPELPKIQGRLIEYKEYSNRNGRDRPAPHN